MSYHLPPGKTIDQLFKHETCHKECPGWQVTCHSLPCYHCFSSDTDAAIEAMDRIENPVEHEFLRIALRNDVPLWKLDLTEQQLKEHLKRVNARLGEEHKDLEEEDMKNFLARVNRRLRVQHKWPKLVEEYGKRSDILMERIGKENWERRRLAAEDKQISSVFNELNV